METGRGRGGAPQAADPVPAAQPPMREAEPLPATTALRSAGVGSGAPMTGTSAPPEASAAGLAASGTWVPAFAPLHAVLALNALAPSLLTQPFQSVAGGLRLLGTRLDFLVNAEAAGLSGGPDALAAYARAHGHAALFLGWDPDERIRIDVALPGDGPWGMTRLVGWWLWCDVGLDGLWLEPPRGRSGERLLQIAPEGLSWQPQLPVTNWLDVSSGRDHVRNATRALRRLMVLDL